MPDQVLDADRRAPDPETIWDQLRKFSTRDSGQHRPTSASVLLMDVGKLPDNGGYKVDVAMTLTAPGCGHGPAIAEDAKSKIMLVPGVALADVRVVGTRRGRSR